MRGQERVTLVAATLWGEVVQEGDTVVDATCGRGNDAVELARLAGATGKLICFDTQDEALTSTRWKLQETLEYTFNDRMSGVSSRGAATKLVLASHTELRNYVEVPPRVVCFNLGYLPRSDKNVVTEVPSTLTALKVALEMLQRGGVVTVVAYPGHDEGRLEAEAIEKLAAELGVSDWVVTQFGILNRLQSPRLFIFSKH